MLFSNNFARISLKVVFSVLVFISLIPNSGAFSCWQCGVFHRGIRDECDLADRIFHNCTACLKTYTRTYIHHSWRKYQYTSKVSKTCVPKNSYKKDAGCYTKTSAGGYVKQCYCYEEFCNTGTSLTYGPIVWLSGLAALGMVVLRL